jgi:hypothetical protein
MTTVNNRLAALALGLIVISVASPSFAQRSVENISAARAAAIHECSGASDKYRQETWGDTQFDVYRACMAEHGQQE